MLHMDYNSNGQLIQMNSNSNDSNMKIRNIITFLILTLAVLSSCDKAFKLELPLAVDSHLLKLSSGEGSTHILVYADGPWTAKLNGDPAWATIDRNSGEGNSELVFTYEENLGIARQAQLILERANLRDTIRLTQSGPITNPSYKFDSRNHSIAAGGGRASFRASGNLEHSVDAIRVAAIFTNGEVCDTVALTKEVVDNGTWITAAEPMADRLVLHLDYNLTKAERSAEILVTIDDPTGRTMKSTMTLVQTADKPILQMSSLSATYEKNAQDVVFKSLKNNIYAYEDDTIIMVSNNAEWIQNPRLTETGLVFSLAENTGAMRTSTISLTYIDDFANIVKSSVTIVQKGE